MEFFTIGVYNSTEQEYFKKLTENRKKRIAVIVVDLFQLKNVDHALGIEGTTQLIKQVAKSLEEKLSSTCIIGHLHSKRFVLLVRDEDRLNEVLEKCQAISEQTYQLERSIGELLNKWSEKILKLGCIPKGVWLVDFDNGRGYYCWRYGDVNSLYFHGYHEGFSGRVAIN